MTERQTESLCCCTVRRTAVRISQARRDLGLVCSAFTRAARVVEVARSYGKCGIDALDDGAGLAVGRAPDAPPRRRCYGGLSAVVVAPVQRHERLAAGARHLRTVDTSRARGHRHVGPLRSERGGRHACGHPAPQAHALPVAQAPGARRHGSAAALQPRCMVWRTAVPARGCVGALEEECTEEMAARSDSLCFCLIRLTRHWPDQRIERRQVAGGGAPSPWVTGHVTVGGRGLCKI